MNDNEPIAKQDWTLIVEQEWGFRPLSFRIDHDNPKMIHVTFAQKLNIAGDMRIRGCEIVMHAVEAAQPVHPFNGVRRQRGNSHLTQAVLAIR